MGDWSILKKCTFLLSSILTILETEFLQFLYIQLPETNRPSTPFPNVWFMTNFIDWIRFICNLWMKYLKGSLQTRRERNSPLATLSLGWFSGRLLSSLQLPLLQCFPSSETSTRWLELLGSCLLTSFCQWSSTIWLSSRRSGVCSFGETLSLLSSFVC